MGPIVLNLFRIIRIIYFLVLITSFPVSCSGTDYTTQHFSYPPGSKPHENNWQYTTLVIVSSTKSPITCKSRKHVKIKVYDNNKTNFLDDKFEFVSASITAHVVWVKFDEINIELIEVGNEFADDSYNRELIKHGPKKLVKILYRFNKKDKKFTVANKKETKKKIPSRETGR